MGRGVRGKREHTCCLAHQPGRMGYPMLRQGALEEKQLYRSRDAEVTERNRPCHRRRVGSADSGLSPWNSGLVSTVLTKGHRAPAHPLTGAS